MKEQELELLKIISGEPIKAEHFNKIVDAIIENRRAIEQVEDKLRGDESLFDRVKKDLKI